MLAPIPRHTWHGFHHHHDICHSSPLLWWWWWKNHITNEITPRWHDVWGCCRWTRDAARCRFIRWRVYPPDASEKHNSSRSFKSLGTINGSSSIFIVQHLFRPFLYGLFWTPSRREVVSLGTNRHCSVVLFPPNHERFFRKINWTGMADRFYYNKTKFKINVFFCSDVRERSVEIVHTVPVVFWVFLGFRNIHIWEVSGKLDTTSFPVSLFLYNVMIFLVVKKP